MEVHKAMVCVHGPCCKHTTGGNMLVGVLDARCQVEAACLTTLRYYVLLILWSSQTLVQTSSKAYEKLIVMSGWA